MLLFLIKTFIFHGDFSDKIIVLFYAETEMAYTD